MALPTVTLPQYSAFLSTPVYQDSQGDIFFGQRVETFFPDPTDTIFVVTQGLENRLDLISNQLYGTPQLWWVLAENNSLVDAQVPIPVGTRLRCPSPNRVPSLQNR